MLNNGCCTAKEGYRAGKWHKQFFSCMKGEEEENERIINISCRFIDEAI